MGQFKTDTDLSRILQKDLLIGHHNKPGAVIRIVVDLLRKHLQPVRLRGVGTADCSLAFILVIQDLLCCDCGVGYTDLLPVAVGI